MESQERLSTRFSRPPTATYGCARQQDWYSLMANDLSASTPRLKVHRSGRRCARSQRRLMATSLFVVPPRQSFIDPGTSKICCGRQLSRTVLCGSSLNQLTEAFGSAQMTSSIWRGPITWICFGRAQVGSQQFLRIRTVLCGSEDCAAYITTPERDSHPNYRLPAESRLSSEIAKPTFG